MLNFWPIDYPKDLLLPHVWTGGATYCCQILSIRLGHCLQVIGLAGFDRSWLGTFGCFDLYSGVEYYFIILYFTPTTSATDWAFKATYQIYSLLRLRAKWRQDREKGVRVGIHISPSLFRYIGSINTISTHWTYTSCPSSVTSWIWCSWSASTLTRTLVPAILIVCGLHQKAAVSNKIYLTNKCFFLLTAIYSVSDSINSFNDSLKLKRQK